MSAPENIVSYAKTARPLPTNALARPRCFGLLDQAITRPVVWVSGPPGAGKTTAVADYLAHRPVDTLWYQVDHSDSDPATFFYFIGHALLQRQPERQRLPRLSAEYLGDLEQFTRHFFRELFSRLHAPFALVLDNFQEAGEDSGLLTILQAGLAEVPPGGNVLLVSRLEPPAVFARLRANERLAFIGWEDLKLTRAEHDGIVALRGLKYDESVLALLYRRTQGWVVALAMLLTDQRVLADGSEMQPSPQLLFDYFGEVIFRRFDAPTRELLLRLALLPQISPVLAQQLCPRLDVPALLQGLSQYAHLLISTPTSNEALSQLHPLAREFLQRKAREVYSTDELLQARREAARILADNSQPDAAAQLLLESQDWQALQSLVLQHASLLLNQGRGETLARWIAAMPDSQRDAEPWLHHWLAAARFAAAPAEAIAHYERAWQGFSASSDREALSGRYLTLAALLDALVLDPNDLRVVDHWIAQAEQLLAAEPDFPSAVIESRITQSLFMALVLRQPQHPQLYQWGERTLALVQQSGQPQLRMTAGLYVVTVLIWTGQFPKAAALIESLRTIAEDPAVPPLALVTLRQLESMYYLLLGKREECLEAVYDGVDMARNSGVRLWLNTLLLYGAGSSLAAGDLKTAADLLTEVDLNAGSMRRFASCMREYFHGWHALLRGDSWQAHEHARAAVRLAEQLGAPFFQALAGLALVQALVGIGEARAATEQLERTLAIAAPIRSRLFDFMAALAAAQLARLRGDNDAAEGRLREALALGRERGFTYAMFWLPEQLAQLAVYALERNIEPAYVASLIRARGLLPAAPPYRLESWPWVWRVRVLGGFQLDMPTRNAGASSRTQSRVLELLKVLVTAGGQQVPLQQVADAMWPRIDSDYAHRSLTTTLHRLRKLLGDDTAVQLQDGKLSLHMHRFWADSWALEQELADCRALLRPAASGGNGAVAGVQGGAERALSIYRGQLLAQERDYAWAMAPRQQLHARVLRLMADAAQHLEERGQMPAAAALLNRVIELDPLSESLYRQLMMLYLRHGRRVEAVDVYERCRAALLQSLKSEPSPQMQQLFAAAQGNAAADFAAQSRGA